MGTFIISSLYFFNDVILDILCLRMLANRYRPLDDSCQLIWFLPTIRLNFAWGSFPTGKNWKLMVGTRVNIFQSGSEMIYHKTLWQVSNSFNTKLEKLNKITEAMTIGVPRPHLNSAEKGAKLDKGPTTRKWGGLCGSVRRRCNAFSGVLLLHLSK